MENRKARVTVDSLEGGEERVFVTSEDAWNYAKTRLPEIAVVQTVPEGGGNIIAFFNDGIRKGLSRRAILTSRVSNEYIKMGYSPT